MACAQTSFLSSTEGRSLEGERISLLVHAYHSTLPISFLSLFSPFCYFDSFPLFSFFLNACSCGVMVIVVL